MVGFSIHFSYIGVCFVASYFLGGGGVGGGLGPASMVYWLWRCAYGVVLWFIVCSFGGAGFVVTGSGSILSVFGGFFSSCGRQAVIMR